MSEETETEATELVTRDQQIYVDVPNDRHDYVPSEHVGHPIIPNKFCRGWNGKEGRMKYCRHLAGFGTDHLGYGRCKFHGGNRQTQTIHGLDRRYALKNSRISDLLEKHESDPDPLSILPEIALLRALSEDFISRYDHNMALLAAWHAERHLSTEQQNAMYQLIDDYEEMLKSGVFEPTMHQIELPRLAREAVKHLGDEIERPASLPDISDAIKHISETTRSVERVFTMQAKSAITFEQLKRFLFAAERCIEGRVRAAIVDPKAADLVLEKIGEDLRGIRP
jgi:hypothetical protein